MACNDNLTRSTPQSSRCSGKNKFTVIAWLRSFQRTWFSSNKMSYRPTPDEKQIKQATVTHAASKISMQRETKITTQHAAEKKKTERKVRKSSLNLCRSIWKLLVNTGKIILKKKKIFGSFRKPDPVPALASENNQSGFLWQNEILTHSWTWKHHGRSNTRDTLVNHSTKRQIRTTNNWSWGTRSSTKLANLTCQTVIWSRQLP